jgi:heptosyltransferase-2
MSTPALLRLREAHAQARITLLTPAKLAGLWKHHPALDDVLEIGPAQGLLGVARQLRAAQFDTALILPNSPRSALEPFLARIPRRVGYGRPWRNWLLTERIAPRPEEVRMRKRTPAEVQSLIAQGAPRPASIPAKAHHLYHYLHLAAALGAKREPLPPLIAVSEQESETVRQRFRAPTGTDRPPLFGLNAGAEYGPAKRWPRERFVAAAIALQRQLGCHWWIVGSSLDVPLASSIAAEITAAETGSPETVRCLAGQTSLRELCAALRVCDLVLTNDTGPMHLAAAVGTPVVVPFGSTSPELTCPGLPMDCEAAVNPIGSMLGGTKRSVSAAAPPEHQFLRTVVPCAPCFLRECPIDFRCMTGITVESVVAAVLRGLAATRAG